jgi:hypothetical protein
MSSVSKTFQELITFSRSTSATYVNSAGYIANTPVVNYLAYSNQPENAAWTKSNSFVQQNLLTYSEDFTNAVWIVPFGTIGPVVANSTVSPIGTLTADTVSATSVNAIFWQTYSPTAGAVYTGSIWLKRKTGTGVVSVTADGATFTTVDLSSGGWVRGTQSYTAAIGTKAVGIRIATSGDEVYIWGAQLVLGAVPGDYRATTTAALPVLYPDWTGALRARKLCETTAVTAQHVVYQQVVVGTASSQFTSVIKVKAGERSAVRFINYDGTSNYAFMYVNLTTGAIQSSGAYGTASNATFAVTSLGNGWFLLAITCDIPSSNRQSYLNISNPIGTTDYTGDGSSGIYIADAQLEPGTSVGPYYDTSATLTYAQRRDYSPVTLASLGLLVEESRTNLLRRSNELTTTPWTVQANTNLTATSALSPDGTVNAWKMYASNGFAPFGILQSTTKAASALTYATSIYAKAAGQNWLQIAVFDGTNGNRYWFNVSTGAVGTTAVLGIGFTGVSASIVPAGNGFYRCVLVATSSTVTTYSVYVYPALANGDNGTGDASGNGVYVYGAQLEQGAFATSYIPTVGSQLTRAADVASVNTLSPWYNATEGTLYAEATAYAGTTTNRYYELSDGTSTNVIQSFAGPSTIYTEWVYVGGAPQAQLSSSGSPTSLAKIAAAYKQNDFAASLNGATPATDTSGAIPPVNKLNIGSASNGTSNLNGHIRRITYYPQRLTNAQLQSITT